MSPDVGTSRASRSRLLFGVGFRPRSASQAIDLPSDGGAILNACLHAEARKSVAESGDRALDLGHRSAILWDAKPSDPHARDRKRRRFDHHRGLRARLCATASADGSSNRHQDRHLMTESQICSSSSLPLDWPRQSMSRYPPVIAIRPTTYAVRRQAPLICQPLAHRQLTGSVSIPYPALGIQIPMTPAALLASRQRGFPS
jgi:hypothetical protein